VRVVAEVEVVHRDVIIIIVIIIIIIIIIITLTLGDVILNRLVPQATSGGFGCFDSATPT
jgi:sorbitol-specific phosphotransferase system component IIBC